VPDRESTSHWPLIRKRIPHGYIPAFSLRDHISGFAAPLPCRPHSATFNSSFATRKALRNGESEGPGQHGRAETILTKREGCVEQLGFESEDSKGEDLEETILIDVSTLPKLNLALQQNAVPLIQDLGIRNNTQAPLERVELVLQSDPPVCQQQIWRMERVGPEVHYRLPERALNISAKFLSELQEAVRAVLSFRLMVSGQEVCTKDVPLEVLSKDEWGGVGHIPEIAAAFVRPNDVAVERIIKQAAEVLRKRSKPSAFDGYTTGDRKRVWEVLSSLWASVCSLGLDYILPPASFEQQGQKVRSPSRVLEAGLGTCLDLCLLFASCIEQCGLNPLLVFLDGHAFPGAWLSDEDFSTAVVDDPLFLRKRIELGEMVLFESTLAVTERPAPPFSFACQTGAGHLNGPKSFIMAVDVKRARIQRIKPLDEARPAPVADAGPAQVQEPAWEEAPDLPESIDLPPPDAQTDVPGGRLEKWKRQLLDLSLRNKLLNFKPGKTAIFLNCPDPARLEDMLADGERFKILPDPRVMLGNDPRSQEIHRQQNQEEARLVHARQALERKELLADGPGDQLDGRLVELFRAVRSQLEEGGANTLYLAIGILNWKKDQTSDRTHKAPLILIPVILHRRSVQSGFTVTMHEDTPRFNPTLLQMLRQDHALSMTEFEGDLPTDESGLDIPLILRTVRQHVRDIPGWSVSDGVVLATFSFSKYLMWKDLADRTDQLKENPIVRHLIDTPREPYGSADDFPRAEDLDDTLPVQECFTPLMSDSSQLAAVAAASRGKDFVLVGPPGTGKSQTITNIIAQCLAMGQSVLFVSEKKAALDVVHRRLRDVGLSDFCLELHSNKANKVEALNQLRAACDASEIFDSSEWERESHRLQSLRSQLNAFVRRLHHRHSNGLSAYQAMGRCIAGGHVPQVNLSWPDARQHDADAMDGLRDVARRIGITSHAVGEISGHPLTGLSRGEWSPSWQNAFMESETALSKKTAALLQAIELCCKSLGLSAKPGGRTWLEGLSRLSRLLVEAHGKPYKFILSSDASPLLEQLRNAINEQTAFRETWSELSVPYQTDVLDLDLNALGEAASKLQDNAYSLKIAARACCEAIGLPAEKGGRQWLIGLSHLTELLVDAQGKPYNFIFSPEASKIFGDLRIALTTQTSFREAWAGLTLPYQMEVLDLDLNALGEAASKLQDNACSLRMAARACCEAIGLPAEKGGRQWLIGLSHLAELLVDAHGKPYNFIFSPEASKILGGLRTALTTQASFREAWAGLSVPYHMESMDLDIEILEDHWVSYNTAWWFKRTLGHRGVSNKLRQLAENKSKSKDVPGDIKLLLRAKQCRDGLTALDHLLGATGSLWQGLETVPEELHAAFAWADAERSAMNLLADTSEEQAVFRQAISLTFGKGEVLSTDGFFPPMVKRLQDAIHHFEQSLDHFSSLARVPTREIFPEKMGGWGKTLEVSSDVVPLRRAQQCRDSLTSLDHLRGAIGSLWQGLETVPEVVHSAFAWADAERSAMNLLADTPEEQALYQQALSLTLGKNENLSADGLLPLILQRLQDAIHHFEQSLDHFSSLARVPTQEIFPEKMGGWGKTLEVSSDIVPLRRARQCRDSLTALDHLRGATCGLWRGLDTAPEHVEAAFKWMEALKPTLTMISNTPAGLSAVKQAAAQILELDEVMLSPEGLFRPQVNTLTEAREMFEDALERFASLAETPSTTLFPEKDEGWLESIGERCRAWRELAPKIKNWCAWRGVRQEAVSVGLSPLISALESLSGLEVNVPELFEVNYCRWWLQVLVDDDEVLRSFVSHVHEGRIDEFRKLDETIMGLTKSCVRARLCGRMAGLDDKSRKSETGILNGPVTKSV